MAAAFSRTNWLRSVALVFLGAALQTCGYVTAAAATDEPAPTESVSLDLASYENELSRVAEAAKDPALYEGLRRSLPETWVVSLNDQRIDVPTAQIRETLWSMEKDSKKVSALLPELQARLVLMKQDAVRMERSGEDTNPRDVAADAKLKDILNRREFSAATGPTASEMLRARIQRWILQHVVAFLDGLNISQATGNFLAWVVIGAAAVVLFVVIYRKLERARASSEFRAQAEPVARDARLWFREAIGAAERNDYREAIHCAYWAAISRLEDLRLLSEDRARTPRESLRLLDRSPKEQGFLRTITGRFELIWYGYQPATADDWGLAKEQLEKMGCQSSTAPTGRS